MSAVTHVRATQPARAGSAPHVRTPAAAHVRHEAPHVRTPHVRDVWPARAYAAPHVRDEPAAHVRTDVAHVRDDSDPHVQPQVTHVRDDDPHVRDGQAPHVRDGDRELVAARDRAIAADPNLCTFCGEPLPADARARGGEFCDRTCAKRQRWFEEDRTTECRTCNRSLPDSVIQRHGHTCPDCRKKERGAT